MAKGDNAGGGLPKGLFDAIFAQLQGAGKGTDAERAAVFAALALEEHFALYPGRGSASMADAMLKYVPIAQAADDLTNAATPANVTAAINKLVPAIDALGKLWKDFGPVGTDFLESLPKP